MSQKLSYPGFSVVFIQTFSVHHTKEFILPERAIKEKDAKYIQKNEQGVISIEKADALRTPIAWLQNRVIENLIFSLPANSPHEAMPTVKKKFLQKPRRVPMKGNVWRFSLRGFDFTMPIKENETDKDPRVKLSGHCNIEMNLFFGHTVSITYRFLFDGKSCSLSNPAITDDLIIFLSTWLNAENWSQAEDEEEGITTIEYPTHLQVDAIWLNADGDPLEEPESFKIEKKGRGFDEIALRYKNYLYKYCTQFKENIPRSRQKKLLKKWAEHPFGLDRDLRYAMVDIWENIQHINEDGTDLFENDKKKNRCLNEAQIIDHIREEHKDELVGLLSLYPEEWIYRDPRAFDEVCGENIAIDTDDLVLAGSSLCVVIGTYGRRGKEGEGFDWKKLLKERAHFHVSWPEYLLIVQMILAKKYVIGLATDEIVESSLTEEKEGAEEFLIKENADMSMRLTRLVTQLDILKYAKYPSHKVMYNRTSKRLGLDEDYARLNTIMENVDSSLHNITDYKAMRSDFFLNVVLAIISVASTFELLYQNAEMPFITHIFKVENSGLASWVVAVVAGVTIFAVGYVLTHYARIIVSRIRSRHHE